VLVRSLDAGRVGKAIALEGGKVTPDDDGVLRVVGMDAARIGELASAGGFVVHEVTPIRSSLEEAFMELTRDTIEYGAGDAS
jgi:ABC-2 type transport system ATP-binding protein